MPNVRLVGIGLQPGDQLLEVVRRQGLATNDQLRVGRDQHDRLEILLQVVVAADRSAVADMGVPLADVDGVAVGRRARDAADADAAAGAADVLDDHRLTERGPHALRQDARHDVGRAARRERHDHRDRPRRIGLRVRAGDAAQDGKCRREPKFFHAFSP